MPEVVFLMLLERALLTLSNALKNTFEYEALSLEKKEYKFTAEEKYGICKTKKLSEKNECSLYSSLFKFLNNK